MTDYWLSKLLFDLQSTPSLMAEYKKDRAPVLDRYKLSPEARAAITADEIGFVAPRVNPYLLRFYFQAMGFKDVDVIARLRALQPAPQKETAHG
jgi:hypothetical protein